MDGWMGGKAGLRIAYSNQKTTILRKISNKQNKASAQSICREGSTVMTYAHQNKNKI
jgi:hypothetical protein